MTITFSELIEDTPDTANGTVYATPAYLPAANRGLVAFVYASGTADAAPTFTGNGLTWALFGQNTRGANNMYAFTALTGSSPTSTAGTFTCAADAATGAQILVVQIAGCDLTDFVGLSDTSTETIAANTPTASFGGTIAATSGILAFLANTTSPAGVTPPSGFTETMDTGWATPTSGCEAAWHASPGAVSSITWGSTTATQSSQIALEILEAAASGMGPVPSERRTPRRRQLQRV